MKNYNNYCSNTKIKKFLKKYENFSLLEYKNINNKVEFYISKDLKNILINSDNLYAKKLLDLESREDFFPITYLDIDYKNPKLISFLNNKDVEKIPMNVTWRDSENWSVSKRQKSKVGKVFNKLLNIDTIELEKLVNDYLASYKETVQKKFDDFEIVDGEDLVYWYNCDNYEEGGGTLHNSCMRNAEYLELYEKNPESVKLLILKNNEGDKIKGRALIWWNTKIPKDKKFMDRIYTIDNSDVNLFIKYAKKEGWIYKSRQGFNAGQFINSETGEIEKEIRVELNSSHDSYEYYPYLDTLYYYDSSKGILSSSSNIDYDKELLDNSGGFSSEEQSRAILRQELEMEGLEYIIDTYGLRVVLNNVDEESAIKEIIDSEVEFYYDGKEDFLDSWSHKIEISDDIMFDLAKEIFFNEFYSAYENEIYEYCKDKFNYEGDKEVDELKKFLNQEQIDEIIKYMGEEEDYYEIMKEYRNKYTTGEINDLIKELWDILDNHERESIIIDILTEHYKAEGIESIYNNFYGDSSSGYKWLENYVNMRDLIEEIVQDIY